MGAGEGCPKIGPKLRSLNDMEALSMTIQIYRMQRDKWPPEEGASLVRVLEGKEPQTSQLAKFDSSQLDRRRRLIDAWGTALKFEFSVGRMRIVSAGQDRAFGTTDDLVVEH